MTRDEVLWHKCPAQSIIHRALEYVCSKFSGIPLSVCSLDVHIRISPNGKYMKFTHLYQSSYKIKLFLVLEISFVQKVSLFTLSSKHFPLYFMFAWFNFVMFFSLVFVEKNYKKQTVYAWNFLQPPMQMCESALIPLYKNQYALFLQLPVFQRFS